MATNYVQIENDSEIKKRLEAERMRLRKIAGLDQPTHFHRPIERAFTAEERNRVTILFGGFTWKHEDLIRAVFQGCGYRCEKLPVPDVPAFQIGKEYGNNGQCNPTYFTVGNLVQYLQFLEKEGIPRKDILDNYVFFTAGSCGPCRFGMYEAEYRFALKNAGFDGFRVLLFKDSDGIKAASGEPGLKFTVDDLAAVPEDAGVGGLPVDGEGLVDLDALAGLDAAAAEDALLRVVAVEGVGHVLLVGLGGELAGLMLHVEVGGGVVDGAVLVVAATSLREVNEAVYQAAKSRGILCNAVDDPDRCDFYYGSLVRRGDLQVAISTAGQSPALAQRLLARGLRPAGATRPGVCPAPGCGRPARAPPAPLLPGV